MSSRESRVARSITALAASCAAALIVAPSVVHGDSLLHCFGKTMKWHSPPTIWRNPNIVNAEPVISAFTNGIAHWTAISNVVQGVLGLPEDDDHIGLLDLVNEVGFVADADMDGFNGLTHEIRDVCVGIVSFPSDDYQYYTEDIWISDRLAFPDPDPRTGSLPPFEPGPGNNPHTHNTVGRVTFAHEFGHFFGLDHTESHDIMRAREPVPIGGAVDPVAIWPNDVFEMALLYGIQDLPNLIVSSTGIVRELIPVTVVDPSGQIGEATFDTIHDFVGMLDTPHIMPPALINMCQGDSGTSRFYIGNSSMTEIAGYDLQLRLSLTAPSAGNTDPGIPVTVGTHSLRRMEDGYFDLPFTIPTSVPIGSGPWFIYLDVDPSNALGERDESDNTTVSSMAIQITC